MSGPERLARVLLVDDERNVVNAIARQLHGLVDAVSTTSPKQAARLLEEAAVDQGDGFSVVLSDLRMPEMDGTALLKHALTVSPSTTRLLLTGYADLQSAIRAVNESDIFRILTKPCPAAQLRTTLLAAIEHHELLRERGNLLEATLRGVGEVLTDALPAMVVQAVRELDALVTRGVAREVALAELGCRRYRPTEIIEALRSAVEHRLAREPAAPDGEDARLAQAGRANASAMAD